MAKRWYYNDANGNKVPVPQYKIDADDYYTKAMSDSRYYDKSATDTMLYDKVSKSEVVQSTGTSTTAVMSQKAVSDAINKLKNAGYLYTGIANPTTNPGMPDGPVFYMATEAGVYANFDGIEVSEGEAVILQWNGNKWLKKTSGLATQQQFSEIDKKSANINILPLTWEDGYINSWNGNLMNSDKHAFVDVEVGSIYTIHTFITGSLTIILYNGDNISEVITAAHTSQADDYTILIKDGITKICINCLGTYYTNAYIKNLGIQDTIDKEVEKLGITTSINNLTSGAIFTYIPVDFVYDGQSYTNSLVLYPYDKAGHFEYSDTKKGEKYLLSCIKGTASLGFGLKNPDGSNALVFTDSIQNEVIEITQDGQIFCLSDWSDKTWKFSLLKINITYYNDEIDSLKTFVKGENIDIVWQENSYYNYNLVKIAFNGASSFEYTDTKKGECYLVSVSAGHANICSGIKDRDGVAKKVFEGTPLVETLIIIENDGDSICISRISKKWSASLVKILNPKNEIAIDGIIKNSYPSVSGSKMMGCLDIARPYFDYNHLIVYGQSFAVAGGAISNNNALDGNYMLGKMPIASTKPSGSNVLEPLGGQLNGLISVTCTNAFSTLWRRYENKDAKFIATTGGAGSKSIEELSSGTTYFNDLLNEMRRIKEIADSENKSVGCYGILYIQGESNYSVQDPSFTSEKTKYKYLLDKLLTDIQNAAMEIYGQGEKPCVYIYQTGYIWIGNKQRNKLTITQAQTELAEDREDVFYGCPVYNLPFLTNDHPSGSGYAIIGELMAKHLFSLLARNELSEGVHPIAFSKRHNVIVINCYAPALPLRIDTHTTKKVEGYGFEVYADGTKVSIYSVNVDGSCILLELPIDIEGKVVEIHYGALNITSERGQGNICDSHDNYMSLQKYVYAATENKSCYDIHGRRLDGQRLPLQNFLCNFYKNIDFHWNVHILKCNVGDSQFTPSLHNDTGLSVIYESSDNSVATIDNGILTIVRNGYAKITASIIKDNETYTDELLVIVV